MEYNQELYPFAPNWVTINEHRIHYLDEGKGQVILFSHAPLGSSFMYRRFVEILSKHYRCIALDYPGFGRSPARSGAHYSIATQSEVLEQFIRHLQLKNIIGLGHDTGGPSLFRIAAQHPEWFAALILTDTIIFPTKEYPKIHRLLGIIGSTPISSINALTNFLVKLTINKGFVTRKLSTAEKQQYYNLFDSAQKRRRITELLLSLRSCESMMKEILKGFQHQLRSKPTLLIYGEEDPVTKLGIPERIHAMVSNSELYFISKEGHFPHEGQPERMSEIIYQWINKL